ncbi:tyrosine-protein phosphatase [Robertmurraya andreesenii]|uniref:Tyrosine-protein phosphatase n=1 Tax=Anoxybacillus andreesenii TaxID=1325932 RepID=A0ABT9V339_9BACL|nr:CpsB/CapC family capsule biosynthesis tyrosine phosphatase [Robertmurraya andreesenii]MDQ0155362.1 protein-tyrosine phosphatase [Robertmurraya andreesenii]
MVDIHSHIIPGVDDGPPQIAEFIEMAVAAVSNGITDLIATPHHMNGVYENPKEKIRNAIRQYQKYLQNEGIPLSIHPGQELRLHRDMFKLFEKEVLTLNDKGRYLLLELSAGGVPPNIHHAVYELRLKGIVPIIAHPERNKGIEEEPNLLYELIHEGALVQVTAASVLGNFGKKAKALSEKLIEHHMVHFIASDAHNCSSRGFSLQEAYRRISADFGRNFTAFYKTNAEALLMGEKLEHQEPVPIRKKILGLF